MANVPKPSLSQDILISYVRTSLITVFGSRHPWSTLYGSLATNLAFIIRNRYNATATSININNISIVVCKPRAGPYRVAVVTYTVDGQSSLFLQAVSADRTMDGAFYDLSERVETETNTVMDKLLTGEDISV